MRFLTFEETAERFRGRSVAIVGSAPSVLENEPGFVDSHEVVVRVNNFKLGREPGIRADVHYSFYGNSVRTTLSQMEIAGVSLCMCKCPDAKTLDSPWHERTGKIEGVDYRYIYRKREGWWPCDTYVPDVARYLAKYELLGRHIPTTGFAAILDVLACEPRSLYLTGFDFFASGKHNVDEPWKPGDPSDPIGHRPEAELRWLADNQNRFCFSGDNRLEELLMTVPA